jgi:hypothetical protein
MAFGFGPDRYVRIAPEVKIVKFTISLLKIRIFVRDRGEAKNQPAGILKYVEDLRRGLTADIGRKDFFEMAYNIIGKSCWFH